MTDDQLNIRLEQYKILRKAIQSLIDERNFHIRLYLGITISVYAAYGAIYLKVGFPDDIGARIFVIGLAVGAITIAWLWRKHMVSYDLFLTARYMALKDIGEEFEVPFDPFERDFESRKKLKAKRGMSVSLSNSEFVARTPLIFAGFGVLFFLFVALKPFSALLAKISFNCS